MAPSQEAQINVLQNQVRTLELGQVETRELIKDQQKKTEEAIKELEQAILPLSQAFQRAKGFYGALFVVGTIALLGIGASAKSVWEGLLGLLKP